MEIINSTNKDIVEIFRLYNIASEYQKSKKTVVVWPEFEKQLVETEIAENRQWKLIIDNEVACVWAITFSDEQIWEERNVDKAIYIHRIATNPNFRGQNFVSIIVKWAKEYATNNKIDYIRLDTLGNNVKLIEHYTSAGFNFLGMFDLKDTKGLPDHYHGVPACLFEIKLTNNKEVFTYREGSINDKEQLKKLGIISYGQYSSILTPDNWAKLNGFLHDDDKLVQLISVSKCFVCEHNNEIIGMAHIIPSGNPWDIFPPEWSYIRMVGVNPKHQGHGIAKKLTKMCVDHARQAKEKTIALHTSEFMDAARHVYESVGFKILREIEPRFDKKYWLYTLELN